MEYTKSQKYKNHGKKYCIMMVDVVEIPVGSTAALASPWDNNYFTYVTREWRWPLQGPQSTAQRITGSKPHLFLHPCSQYLF